MKKIGIFGGTFNPVHKDHIAMARAAIEKLSLDKLIVMPTFIPPHKEVSLAPAKDRQAMLSLAFRTGCGVADNLLTGDCATCGANTANDGKIEISGFEIACGGKSYTYLTVEHFAGEGELYFIVGGDMLADFKTWRYPERILASAKLAAFGREGFSEDVEKEREYFKENFGKEFIYLTFDGAGDSSTEIRVYNSLSLDISGFTDLRVAEYIKKNGLYAGGAAEKYVREHLPLKRLIHTANVAVCALKKARETGLSEEKILTAAILHDCAKYADMKDFPDFTLPEGVPEPVVHSFLGAYVAEKVVGIKDEEVLDAIRYHTSGKAAMTTLGKLIFVADMIEKGRDYEGVEKLRRKYDEGLDECFKACLKEEVIHLLNKKSYVYSETLNAYEYYITQNKKD